MRSWRPITGGMRHPDRRSTRQRTSPAGRRKRKGGRPAVAGRLFFAGAEELRPFRAGDEPREVWRKKGQNTWPFPGMGRPGTGCVACCGQRGHLLRKGPRKGAAGLFRGLQGMKNGTMLFQDTSISFQKMENKEALARKAHDGHAAHGPAGEQRGEAKDHPLAGGLHIFGMQTNLSPGTPHGPGPGPAAGPWGWAGSGGRRLRGWRGSGRGAACGGRRRPAARPCCGPSASKNRWP